MGLQPQGDRDLDVPLPTGVVRGSLVAGFTCMGWFIWRGNGGEGVYILQTCYSGVILPQGGSFSHEDSSELQQQQFWC